MGSNAVLTRISRIFMLGAFVVFGATAFDTARRTAPIPESVQDSPGDDGTRRVELANEAAFFDDAAVTAFTHFNRLWRPRTGLAVATPAYDKLTPWDIASVMAANYSANVLGLLSDPEYNERMGSTLKTLEKMPLYRGAVFHKMYLAETGKMVGRNGKPTTVGYGWSATDLGRILLWLRIVAENDPQFRDQATRIAKRIKFKETTKNGYMVGGMWGSSGKLWTWQEGRIGYEQYSAEGYAYWGGDVANALDINKHAKPFDVLGVTVLADDRKLDRLNSEPFVLMGMELGFTSPAIEELARNVLAAQEARFKQTGKLTMVSEDAVSVPPHYFYYYCVLCNGKTFTIDVSQTGKNLDKPRWVSTKAAFGYHALMGTEYTKRVMEAISGAKSEDGWSSGVFEGSLKSTTTYDINTTAVVLEAAAYRKLGRPLIQARNGSSSAGTN